MRPHLLLPLLLLAVTAQASGQGYYEFLGPARPASDKFTPRYHIRYNAQGFDSPAEHRTKKMVKKGASESAIQEVENFPRAADEIARWIDDAYENTRAEFLLCGGDLASRAMAVSPSGVYVIIEPTAFYVGELGIDAAGVYYPSRREIHVLNIYYTWSGPYRGWLRHARDLLRWEMENYFGTECRIQAEPRTSKWPCDAPRG